MSFLALVGSGAVGSFIVSTALSIGASVGLSFLSKKLFGGEQQATSGGAVLETRFGENIPRVVAIGTCCAKVPIIYDNAFGTANKTSQRVFKLSDFYTTSLERVAIDGEWVTLGALDATKGYPVTTAKYSGYVWVKFYDGHQTAADPYLVDNANPEGRWTEDHKGIGISYVIVTMVYDQENFNSVPAFMFEFKGAPLYDIAKDSTAGGLGTHRFDNVSTWEYSNSPILADYCYRRGYSVNNDIFCGMATPASDLPFFQYVAARNVCTEQVDGENRYAVSIFLDATKEHGDNINDLMGACAGRVASSVEGQYPIMGASQVPVATLSDADLVDDAPVEFNRDRHNHELINTISGIYSEPDLVYQTPGYKEQTLAGIVAVDRETLDINLSLPMVTSKRQAEQLASIYLSENRFEATKQVTVQEKWQTLYIGEVINWINDMDGAASRTYKIVGKDILSLDSAPQRHVALQLEETDVSIYAGIGVVTPPQIAFRNGDPVYQNELTTFSVTPTVVEAENGDKYPALQAIWDPISDPTIDNVQLQWRVKAAPDFIFDKITGAGTNVGLMQEGIVGSTLYQVRNRIITSKIRQRPPPSAWIEVTTDPPPAYAGLIPAVRFDIDARDAFISIWDEVLDLKKNVALIGAQSEITALVEKKQTEVIEAKYRRSSASVSEERAARITATGANAFNILTLDARVVDAEGDIAGQSTAINSLSATVTTVDGKTVANTQDITALDARVFNSEGDIAGQSTAINQLEAEVTTIDGITTATAQALTLVESSVDEVSAQGLFLMQTSTAPAGWAVRLGLAARYTVGGLAYNAGLYTDIKTNGDTQIVAVADKFKILNASGSISALFDGTGDIATAYIPSITTSMLATNSVTAVKVFTHTLTANEIEINGLTGQAAKTANDTSSITAGTGGSWLDVSGLSLTVSVSSSASLMIFANAVIQNYNGYTPQNSIRVLMDGSPIINTNHFASGLAGGNGGYTLPWMALLSPSSGTHTFKVQWKCATTAGARMFSRQFNIIQFLR